MSMTVKRSKDIRTPRVFMHKTADIRGGVSVAASELGGDYLREGAVLSPAVDGICHVVKIASVTADVGATDTAIKVAKFHNFKVGDVVLAKAGDKAYPITAIDTANKKFDTITISETLGEIATGGFIVEAKAEAATKAEVKYQAQSVNGTGKPFDHKSNINTDAWLIGVTQGNALPDFIASELKGIINL